MEINKKLVLVTGGAGFIGSHLVEQLLLLGAEVRVLDNFDDFYKGKEENLIDYKSNPRFKLVYGNINDLKLVRSCVKGVDIVFHLAAQAGVRYCIENPQKANETNVTGTLNVLLASREMRVKKVIYASSSSVYGKPVKLPMNEDHPTNPTNPYAATKLAGEKYCLAFGETYGLSVTCLRYFSVYGPRGRPDQVLLSFASKCRSGKPPVIYGDGNQSRDFTYITDVVSATVLAALRDESDGKVLNIGYGKETRILDVAKLVLHHYKLKLEPRFEPSYGGDFPRTLCDNGLARRVLAWQPRVPFEKGADLTLNWFDRRFSQPAENGAKPTTKGKALITGEMSG
ncbi:MAG: NAD-dependent epimerase/dehydratase family protein [Conexivisphaerales archaeon]